MTASNFAASLKLVGISEGGYVDHPLDPGGATNMGITRRTLAAWRGVRPWRKLPKSEVKFLHWKEAGEIYKAKYWDTVSADALAKGLDFAVFDYSVNSGPRRASKALQRVVGVKADGSIGPLTLAAVSKLNTKTIIRRLMERRLSFLQRLRTWRTFGRGWASRVNRVKSEALSMANGD